MKSTATLSARTRSETGKGVARKLRASGAVPAVMYGDGDPVTLMLDAHETLTLFQRISVENTVVTLHVDDSETGVEALVREVQAHPYRTELLHVDFYRVQAGVALDVEIPVRLLGTPIGVKDEGGVLEQIIHELGVRCIPSRIPEVIEVDVSGLAIGDSLHVSDLTVDPDVEITTDEERTLCLVSAPRVEEVDEDDEALDDDEMAEPEMVGQASDDEAESSEDADD